MITIDGSQGEGGGQILRTSLALAAITGTPVRIEKIRARRPKPGLQRQHLVAVQAAARVCNGHLEGAELHSREVVLTPQKPVARSYVFDIGSAGSTTLVLQTVLPILLCADGPSTVSVRGGTHNSMAPPVEFLRESFLPVLHRIGVSATLELERHGFYPAGGGAINATIQPWQARVPLELRERGKAVGRHAEVLIANLPAHVASREAQALKHGLHWSHQEVDEREVPADGPGNAIIARLRHANVTAVCTAFGELRKSAEKVADEAVKQVRRYTATDAPVCEHLSDQLLLPLALGAGGVFRTGRPSEHTLTNAAIIARFLGEVVTITADGEAALVTVRGR
ncbi:MAG TPA: RNA 3'-terminal phosphate cyclase [Planctomycetes bacterium]|nr:RNA 3'-terminal phosphate cyclase [Planctomycetota bacterium]